jgi:NTP pyrophosphatase (non-canonical NTP hydrolase)
MYKGRGEIDGLLYVMLGLAGETGEISNKVKKLIRGDKGGFELNSEIRKELIFEAGDVLWYLSQLAHELGVTLEEIARLNLAKLNSRKERNVIKGTGDNR